MAKKLVVVGLSGGIDSAVSAYLLKKHHYDVIGLFMRSWDEYVNFDFSQNSDPDTFEGCTSEKDYQAAEQVARHLNIPLFQVNFVEEYWDKVFKKMLQVYASGNTPNPDVLCNKFIKFDLFYKYAREKFKCDYLATGHYARKRLDRNGQCHLYLSKDSAKDQTYFLCQIKGSTLKKVLFPLANYTKSQVKEIARQNHFPNYDRKESTGICFIGERKFKLFLNNYLDYKPGVIVDIVTKTPIGNHDGVIFYTIGQRKGINLNLGSAYVVVGKDVENNILYVAKQNEAEPFLTSHELTFRTDHWINGQPPLNSTVLFRFRHRQDLTPGKLFLVKKNHYCAVYPSGSIGITPGQYIVVYSKSNRCYGGGEILTMI